MAELGSVAVGFVLILSGGQKIVRGAAELERIVSGYALLPRWTNAVVARLLPWLEVTLGIWLLAGPYPVLSSIAAASLFVVFAGAVGINLVRGRRDIDCGCLSGSSHGLGWRQPTRALLLAAVALASGAPAIRSSLRWSYLEGGGAARVAAISIVGSALAVVVLARARRHLSVGMPAGATNREPRSPTSDGRRERG